MRRTRKFEFYNMKRTIQSVWNRICSQCYCPWGHDKIKSQWGLNKNNLEESQEEDENDSAKVIRMGNYDAICGQTIHKITMCNVMIGINDAAVFLVWVEGFTEGDYRPRENCNNKFFNFAREMAYYRQKKLTAAEYAAQEIPLPMLGLRDVRTQVGHLVTGCSTTGQALVDNPDANSTDLIFETPIRKVLDIINKRKSGYIVPIRLPMVRAMNSILVEVNQIDQIDQALVDIGAFGYVKWTKNARKKVFWLQFIFKKHLCLFLRLKPDLISPLDPIKAFVDWDIITMSILVYKVPGDEGEDGDILSTYRCQYNSSWPMLEMIDRVVKTHYKTWEEKEKMIFEEWKLNPEASANLACLTEPNRNEHSVDLMVGSNQELRGWIHNHRTNDRLRKANKAKRDLNIPNGSNDVKFTDLYKKVAVMQIQMENESRRRAHEERDRLDRRDQSIIMREERMKADGRRDLVNYVRNTRDSIMLDDAETSGVGESETDNGSGTLENETPKSNTRDQYGFGGISPVQPRRNVSHGQYGGTRGSSFSGNQSRRSLSSTLPSSRSMSRPSGANGMEANGMQANQQNNTLGMNEGGSRSRNSRTSISPPPGFQDLEVAGVDQNAFNDDNTPNNAEKSAEFETGTGMSSLSLEWDYASDFDDIGNETFLEKSLHQSYLGLDRISKKNLRKHIVISSKKALGNGTGDIGDRSKQTGLGDDSKEKIEKVESHRMEMFNCDEADKSIFEKTEETRGFMREDDTTREANMTAARSIMAPSETGVSAYGMRAARNLRGAASRISNFVHDTTMRMERRMARPNYSSEIAKNRGNESNQDEGKEGSIYSEYHMKKLPTPNNMDSISLRGDMDISVGPTTSTPAVARAKTHDDTLEMVDDDDEAFNDSASIDSTATKRSVVPVEERDEGGSGRSELLREHKMNTMRGWRARMEKIKTRRALESKNQEGDLQPEEAKPEVKTKEPKKKIVKGKKLLVKSASKMSLSTKDSDAESVKSVKAKKSDNKTKPVKGGKTKEKPKPKPKLKKTKRVATTPTDEHESAGAAKARAGESKTPRFESVVENARHGPSNSNYILDPCDTSGTIKDKIEKMQTSQKMTSMNMVVDNHLSMTNHSSEIKSKVMKTRSLVTPNLTIKLEDGRISRLIYADGTLIEFIFKSVQIFQESYFRSVSWEEFKLINCNLFDEPSVSHFVCKGKCMILSCGRYRLPVVYRNGEKIEILRWCKLITSQVIKFMKLNKGYYGALNEKAGLKLIDDQIEWLTCFARNIWIKEGERLEKMDVQETDDMTLAERPDLKTAMEWLNLNNLPTTNEEYRTMREWKIKIMKMIKSMEANKFKLIHRFQLDVLIQREMKKKAIKPKKNFAKSCGRLQEETSKEMSISRIEQPRNEPVEQDEAPFHHWHDGTEIYLERHAVEDEDFDKAENEENREPKNFEATEFIKIGYVNVPTFSCQAKIENILEEIVITHPEIDIWACTELYFTGRTGAQCPRDFKMVTHGNLYKKNTMILYRKALESKIQIIPSEINETWIRYNEQVNIAVFYRSPTRDGPVESHPVVMKNLARFGKEHISLRYIKWMNERIEKVMKSGGAIILGDFNMDIHKTIGTDAPKYLKLGQLYWKDVMENSWPNLLKNTKTYYKHDGGKTSIDVISTNRPSQILGFKMISQDDEVFSDHEMWEITIDEKWNKQMEENINSKMKLNFESEHNRKQANEIGQKLKKAMLEEWKSSNDPRQTLIAFSDACKQNLPMKKITKKLTSSKMNFDLDLVAAKFERQKFMEENGIEGLGAFYTARHPKLKEHHKVIRGHKARIRREFWKRKIGNLKRPSEMWKAMKAYKDEKANFPDFITRNGTAKFFKQLSWSYTPLGKKLIRRGNQNKRNEEMTKFKPWKEITNPEIKLEFTRLGPVKDSKYWHNLKAMVKDGKGSDFAYAPDETTLNAIKALDNDGWDILAQCVDQVIRTGRYIQEFRVQKMVPVPKKPVIKIYKEVRPVTVSSALANIVEKVLAKQFYGGSEARKWLHDNQFGFRSSYSIGLLISKMRKIIAKRTRKLFAVIQTDQSNAFGSPDVEAILEELNDKLSDGAFDLIKSFLIQSSASVHYKGKKSIIFKTAPRGFAQGSCMSPIMFCTLMTNSHNEVTAISLTFADDANYLVDCELDEEMKQMIVKTVRQFKAFCDRLNIKLNVGKTFYVNNQDIDLDIDVDGVNINHQSKMKMLGVRMTNKLKITPQVEFVKSKVKSVRHLIKTFGRVCRDEFTQGTLMKSYVIGTFNHASQYIEAWTVKHYSDLQGAINRVLQDRTAKILKGEAKAGKLEDKTVLKEFKKAEKRMLSIKEKYPRYNIIKIPQWIIMRRNVTYSIENMHRMNWLTRMAKLIKTGRPVMEFNELMEHMTDNFKNARRSIRTNMNFPFFDEIKRNEKFKDQDLLRRTTPAIWIKEFRNLTQEMKRAIMGDKMAIEIARRFYKERCQHQEKYNEQCAGCGKSTWEYKNDLVKKELLYLEDVIDEYDEWFQRQVVIFDGQDWKNASESQVHESNEHDIVVINWNQPEERMDLLTNLGLSVNAEIKDLISKIRNIKDQEI